MPNPPSCPRTLIAAVVLGLVLSALSLAQDQRPALALTNCSVEDSFDAEERAFLGLINDYRSRNGLGTLTVSVNLNRSSAWMARDMATKNYFAHTDSLGRSVSTRVRDCGGSPSNGENLAAGTYRDTAQEAFEAWRKSSGHNANMLNSSYRQIGIARYHDASSRYGWYWATDFSTSDDGTRVAGGAFGGSAGVTLPPTATSVRPTATATALPPTATALPPTATAVPPTPTRTTVPPTPTSTPAPTTPTEAALPPTATAVPATPTRTPAPELEEEERFTIPADSSTLGYSVSFSRTLRSAVERYLTYIIRRPGSNNLLGVWPGTRLSVRLSSFWADSWSRFARLSDVLRSGWEYKDYTFSLRD